MSPARSAFSKWVPVETYPIFAVVGGAVAGAGFYLYRLSQGTEVVWNRHGDWRPWDKIKQDQNIKFMTVHPKWWEERKAQVAASTAQE
ncbi:hypothetical protein CC85DRAFT_289577 [Cutaneotrichosporon oleaginosum]|uniref:Uncharacterized protein n=1 Tax=Cutaneotrichosporon oleaginosum TaxID=879819 RepID=A0A0J1ASR5_9TREE|nr:uncharacterized protein CC85DRAFT_289577 [Cutaneotrichosporon oleaginosum]KLT38374.1 hypothetical protein CC85DRAFT_289577 [Cutaneotrichosporon oleaginosum]